MYIPDRFLDQIPDRFISNIPVRFINDEDNGDFPVGAYMLQPNVDGDFTKSMVESAVASGEDYIVFDADNWDVHYEDAPDVVGGWDTYVHLEDIVGTEENPITIDLTKVYINCYPNSVDNLAEHRVFSFTNCENVILKVGTVEGDKYKRALTTNNETKLENTQFFRSNSGSENITVDGGEIAGFMGDIGTANVRGVAIDTSPLSNSYYLQGDGRYESIFYDVDAVTYEDFGLTGGLGYNRLLYYDMFDVTFKFYDENENFISEITESEYFERYSFPSTSVKKMKVNVKPMDGRTESPTNWGHRLEYNPNYGTVVKNVDISDNHRGGIANIGSNAIIEYNNFFNTQRYFDAPKFGINGNTNSTTYHFNAEDAVSKNLKFRYNTLSDKFHKILITHSISADITDNLFTGSGNNIFIYDLITGLIDGNNFVSEGKVNGGNGTNKNQVIVSNNTGSPEIEFSQGANWINNTLTGAKLREKGKASGNTFTNSDYAYLEWTEDFENNTFIGNSAVPYVNPDSYIYKNTFEDTGFRFQHGDENDTIVLDSLTVDYSSTPTNDALYRYNNSVPIISKNSTFKDAKIYHRTSGQAVDFNEGSWYFEGCDFEDITNYIIKLSINTSNTIDAKFFFKDCTFTGSGDFLTGSGNYEITFDNCTIDDDIVMPGTYTNGTVTMPTIVEPRTMPIPEITQETGYNTIAVIYHIFTLQIRDKATQTVVFDEDVCSTYRHYTDNPTDYEYSIDGGKYWDEINN